MKRPYMKKHRESGVIRAVGAVAVVIACALYVWDVFGGASSSGRAAEGECEFHFIDVGQGDCSMFLTDESCIVVDSGTASAAAKTEKYINSYTDKIDYLILTHPHEDHIGGAAELIGNIKVENILMTDAASNSYTFSNLLDKMEQSDARVIQADAGDTYSAGGMDIKILAPLHEFDNLNDYSMVVRISYKDTAALVTGDAEKNSEKLMCERWQDDLNADVLKLGHHGSSTSSSKNFVLSVDPVWAVISCGKNNSYGHPHDVTVELLNDYGIPYVRTDERGCIVFVSDGSSVKLADSSDQ